MFFPDDTTLDLVTRSLVLGPITLVWILVVVNIIGLRTFSKMTAFDFIATVATGSLLANAAVASEWPAFIQSSLAILSVLGVQAIIALIRRKSDTFEEAISNEPVILFRNGEFCRDAMAKTRVAEDDIWAKMREANAMKLEEVQAIILETTGDIAVMHGEELEDIMLTGVKTED